jgi:hypothetical protein
MPPEGAPSSPLTGAAKPPEGAPRPADPRGAVAGETAARGAVAPGAHGVAAHAPVPEGAQPGQVQPAVVPPGALAGPAVPPRLPPAQVRVEEAPARRAGADGRPADVVTLAFTSPTLGRLDLRLELRGEHLLADVTTEAGLPYAVANAARERLRAKLVEAGLEPTVKVQPRHRPFDVYA